MENFTNVLKYLLMNSERTRRRVDGKMPRGGREGGFLFPVFVVPACGGHCPVIKYGWDFGHHLPSGGVQDLPTLCQVQCVTVRAVSLRLGAGKGQRGSYKLLPTQK